jgi:hypothetical protein
VCIMQRALDGSCAVVCTMMVVNMGYAGVKIPRLYNFLVASCSCRGVHVQHRVCACMAVALTSNACLVMCACTAAECCITRPRSNLTGCSSTPPVTD